MKTEFSRTRLFCFSILAAILSFAFAGCKSTPKVDWNSRIGYYTYDQAVTDMGPPDKFTRLSDGRMVADWIKPSHGGMSFGVGTGFIGSGSAVGVGTGTSTAFPDKVLRLTFSVDGKLLDYKKNY